MSPALKDVEEYMSALPGEVRASLEDLRAQIRALVPEAPEVISYQIPTFKYHGPLVGYGAAKNHCAFYVMSPSVMEAHKDELKEYETSKGTIRFQPDRPLPAALVTKLVKARMAENEATAAGRSGKVSQTAEEREDRPKKR